MCIGHPARTKRCLSSSSVGTSRSIKSSIWLCNLLMARSTNSLWFCFVRTSLIVERRRLKVLSPLSVIPLPPRFYSYDHTRYLLHIQGISSYHRVNFVQILHNTSKAKRVFADSATDRKVSSKRITTIRAGLTLVRASKYVNSNQIHPWHLLHWDTIDIFMAQLTSTFGDLDTFVTITIEFRHFQTSKQALHTTHISISEVDFS